MKKNVRLARNPEFLLEQIDNDYQLRRQTDDMAIFINQSAAILWGLCDGSHTLETIKSLLKEAYPDANKQIESDIDESVTLLSHHGALKCE